VGLTGRGGGGGAAVATPSRAKTEERPVIPRTDFRSESLEVRMFGQTHEAWRGSIWLTGALETGASAQSMSARGGAEAASALMSRFSRIVIGAPRLAASSMARPTRSVVVTAPGVSHLSSQTSGVSTT
jgi:hypothetical protein